MTKRHMPLLLCLSAGLLLASCGGGASVDSTSSNSQEASSFSEASSSLVKESSEERASTEDRISSESSNEVSSSEGELSSDLSGEESSSEEAAESSESISSIPEESSESESESDLSSETSEEDFSEESSIEEASSEESSDISSEETKYSISFEIGTHMKVRNLSGRQVPEGTLVRFTLTCDTGFEVDDISVIDEKNVNYFVDFEEGVYSFDMPASDVKVIISEKRVQNPITFDDINGLIDSSVYVKSVGDDDFFLAESLAIEYGAMVRLTLKDVGDKHGNGVYFVEDDRAIEQNASRQVEFVMPSYPITVRALYSEADVSLVVKESDGGVSFAPNLKISFQNAKGTAIEYAAAGDVVYIDISAENDRYGVREIYITYVLKGDVSNSKKDLANSVAADGRYYFTVPNASSVTLVVKESDSQQFADSDVVGSYIGLGMFGASSNYVNSNSFHTEYNIDVDESGTVFYQNQEAHYITSVSESDGIANLENYGSMSFGGNFLFVDMDWRTPLAGYYELLGVKKKDSADTLADYSSEVAVYMISGKQLVFAQVFYKDEPYANAFINRTDKLAYLDVEFSFVNATSAVTDAKSQFEVKEKGEVLARVGYQNDGGPKDRIFMEGVYGDFAGEEGVLRFLGNGKAEFQGVVYDASIEEGVATLSSNTKTITASLDLDNRTYLVTGAEEKESGMPFKGHLYRGSFYSDWEEGTVYFFMSFDAERDVFTSCAGTSSSISPSNLPRQCYMNNSTNWDRVIEEASYTYDAASGTLSTRIFDCAHSSGVNMTFIYSSSLDTFTCTVNYDSTVYPTRNMVLSLVS